MIKKIFLDIYHWLRHGQNVRFSVQLGFLLLILWIGYEFYGFVEYHLSGGQTARFERPPGVEGFLPIGALVSLKYWILSGEFSMIHPSALVLFLIFVFTAVFLKKGFCSWICPVGFISEMLWNFGQKIFGRTFALPKWLDYPLRSLKYLILIFFANAILLGMNEFALKMFIESPYNKLADVKMLLFFANISEFAMWSILILVVLSVVVKNFWCRYLCPYGALLGFLSMFSPVKVTRDEETCIDCKKCTKVCPSLIQVHKANRVYSDECMACGECITACPVDEALQFKITKKSKPIPVWVYGVIIVGVFMLGTGAAMLSGHWKNKISEAEYRVRIQNINSPEYNHAQ
ncbi:MAG: 4Fe-4S binding protein [Calditrichaceae bacterium]